MHIYPGTSGYSYKEWRGVFYPDKLPVGDMLEYYASQLPAGEINNTFYRVPKSGVLETWAAQTPETFRFVLKGTRRITHLKRLKDAGEETDHFFRIAGVLGPRLGGVLLQLPPFLRCDLVRLRDYLALLPSGVPVAMEFRHESWFEDAVYDLLKSHNVALCINDTDADQTVQIVPTANWGYMRLRASHYSGDRLRTWRQRIAAQPWDTAFVFFKHEDEGAGPRLAAQFLAPAEGKDERSSG